MIEIDQFMPTYVPGGMGGGETYAKNIYRALKENQEISLVALLPETAKEFTHDSDKVIIEAARISKSSVGRMASFMKVLLHKHQIVKLFRGSAVKFVPFTAPLISLRGHGPSVVVLHDLQHRELPELFSRAEKIYRKIAYEKPALKADRIITISNFAKESILRHLKVDPNKVTVIHLGVDANEFAPSLGVRQNFVYYPARGWAHKNHKNLIAAMKIVRESYPELRLVFTGGGLEHLKDLPSWVENKGLVQFVEVQELYRQTKVLAFPSLYEGFGLPLIEAMASGTPVAAARVASIPEICGDAAEYFDPRDVQSIANGILRALSNSDRLVHVGIEQAKKFSWQKSAEKHIEVFRSVSN